MPCLWNVESLSSHNPIGLHGLLTGIASYCMYVYIVCIVRTIGGPTFILVSHCDFQVVLYCTSPSCLSLCQSYISNELHFTYSYYKQKIKLRGLSPGANYTDRLTAKLVLTFAERVLRGQRDGSLQPYSRISRPEPLLSLPSSSSIVFTKLSGPRSRSTTSQEIW
jgi:hypothetical protein